MVTKYKISMTLSAEEFMTIFPRIGADVQLEIKKIDTAPVSKEPRAAASVVHRQTFGQRGDPADPRQRSRDCRHAEGRAPRRLASRRPRYRRRSPP